MKVRNIDDFFYLSEGMENCKMSGKSQGILKWMISVNAGDYFLLIHKILLLAYEHVIDYVVGPPPPLPNPFKKQFL